MGNTVGKGFQLLNRFPQTCSSFRDLLLQFIRMASKLVLRFPQRFFYSLAFRDFTLRPVIKPRVINGIAA